MQSSQERAKAKAIRQVHEKKSEEKSKPGVELKEAPLIPRKDLISDVVSGGAGDADVADDAADVRILVDRKFVQGFFEDERFGERREMDFKCQVGIRHLTTLMRSGKQCF